MDIALRTFQKLNNLIKGGYNYMGLNRKRTSEEVLNDYIDRQLAKAKDAEERIQKELDLIYQLAFGKEDTNGDISNSNTRT